MASHGMPRGSTLKPNTEQARRKELRKIQDYKVLVEKVNSEIRECHYTPEVLQLTSELLTQNPEYYTVWNYRRLIVQRLLSKARTNRLLEHATDEERMPFQAEMIEIISNDLNFLIPLLRQYPKCYWIWNYRIWLLEEASHALPAADSQKLWQQELGLAGKMLSLDSRNFNGWGYRRKIVLALESTRSTKNVAAKSMTELEFEYTTRMIESNLSNFSAWHNRSKLIPRLLGERNADHAERRAFLDKELELIQRALYTDSYDQSLWFYHQYLMCNLDPEHFSESMIPAVTTEQSLEYLEKEFRSLLEMLDGAEDCKWIYQSLIHLSRLHRILGHKWPVQESQIRTWIKELRKLDPLRSGRWNDLELQLKLAS